MQRGTIFTLFLMLVCGCTYETTTIYYKKDADFDKFKTFSWLTNTDSLCRGDKVKEEAFHQINHGFLLKGYKIDTLAPDLLLDMQMFDENKMANVECLGHCPTTDYIVYFYPTNDYKFQLVNSSSYPYPQWQYELDTLVYYNKYKERIITLNVIDRKRGQGVWSATALGNPTDDQGLDNVVHPIVQRLMKKFPVKTQAPPVGMEVAVR